MMYHRPRPLIVMLRYRLLLLVFCSAGLASAQPGTDWVARWSADQRATQRGIIRVSMLEKTSMRFEYASGSRNMKVEEELSFSPSGDRMDSRILVMEVDSRVMPPETPEQRARREQAREHFDPQREARRFARPLTVLERMASKGTPEVAEVDGRQLVRIAMTAVDPADPIPRLTAWFDPQNAALVQVRAFVGGQAGSALTVFVRYVRVDGLDLPVRRYTEGSFSFRRREREFSSLVDVRADISEHRVERE